MSDDHAFRRPDWQGQEPPPDNIEHPAKFAESKGIHELDVSRWVGRDPKPLVFTVEGLIPQGMLTLLVSEGGAGKSLLAQMLATCIPTGHTWLGLPTISGTASCVFAEDGEDILHLRQQRINERLTIDMESLTDRLFIASQDDLAQGDGNLPFLWYEGKATRYLTDLETELKQIEELRLVVLDNAALLFSGNENDRGEVTRFLSYLGAMAARLQVGMVLCTHTPKSTKSMASGSTAWPNAARSVLVLENKEDDEIELRLDKANHTKPGEKLELQWVDGLLVRSTRPSQLEVQRNQNQLRDIIIDKVTAGWNNGVTYSDVRQSGERYLPKRIAETSNYKIKEVVSAIADMRDDGVIRMERLPGKRIEALAVCAPIYTHNP